MRITELRTAEKVPIQIDARKMLIRRDCELIHLSLQPGEVLETHTNPFDVAFYVLAGEGDLVVGTETRRIGADTVIEIPAGEMRGWTNSGTEVLRVLVVKLL
ncbi:MAG TPA: cupin domain-containing protein [Geobacteraceae bacterium]|nr:cupin domain-containing protein [Geobacteraceae bacterium]